MQLDGNKTKVYPLSYKQLFIPFNFSITSEEILKELEQGTFNFLCNFVLKAQQPILILKIGLR